MYCIKPNLIYYFSLEILINIDTKIFKDSKYCIGILICVEFQESIVRSKYIKISKLIRK